MNYAVCVQKVPGVLMQNSLFAGAIRQREAQGNVPQSGRRVDEQAGGSATSKQCAGIGPPHRKADWRMCENA